MSRGLGEVQIVALRAFAEHERQHAKDEDRKWRVCCTADGYVHHWALRATAWGEHQYRGTEEAHRRNHPGAFKRALDKLVAQGYVEHRDFEPGYLEGLPFWERVRPRRPHWQYRLTEKGVSVLSERPHTYPIERLTTEHSPAIEAKIEAYWDRIIAEARIPRVK
jgi:hypothetical protein